MFHVGGDGSSQSKSDHSDGAHSIRSSNHSSITPMRSSRYLRPFRSRRIKLDEGFDWAQKRKSKSEKFARLLPWIAAIIGCAMILVGVYWGFSLNPKHKFTKVKWYTDFSDNKFDLVNDWNREVALDAFGANSLDWTTTNDNNSFVKDNRLHIQATLTDPALNVDGAYVNLTADGVCTKNYSRTTCYAERNATSGQFINAVQSARLTTKGKHTLRYGRFEINAKMPLGDWLWPAIWFLPDSTEKYGIWPACGEIDLVESRGNDPGYPGGGYDTFQSSIHMAPEGEDIYATGHLRKDKISNPEVPIPFSILPKEFHTYGMDWTPQYLNLWIDDPIYSILTWTFDEEPAANFGLPTYDGYGRPIISPWTVSSHKSAPFDVDFYLIINVAVAGVPGYFSGKGAPWSTTADFWTAQKQVWEAREELSKTWHQEYQALQVDWVRMTELDNVDYWENLASANY